MAGSWVGLTRRRRRPAELKAGLESKPHGAKRRAKRGTARSPLSTLPLAGTPPLRNPNEVRRQFGFGQHRQDLQSLKGASRGFLQVIFEGGGGGAKKALYQ